MFFKYKLRKAFKSCEGPDYTDRISALACYNKKGRYGPFREGALLCACLAAIILVTFLVTAFFKDGKSFNTSGAMLVDSSLMEQAVDENSPVDVVYGYEDVFEFEDGGSIQKGQVIYSYPLEAAMFNEQNENSLFAVNISLIVTDFEENEDDRRAIKRARVLAAYHKYLTWLHRYIKEVVAGDRDIEELVKYVNRKIYVYEPYEYEAMGGFNRECFDQATIDTVYKLVGLKANRVRDISFLREADKELDYLFRRSDIQPDGVGATGHPYTVWYENFCKCYLLELKPMLDRKVKFLSDLGIEAKALDVKETLTLGASWGVLFPALATKDQLMALKDSDYGVYVSLQNSPY